MGELIIHAGMHKTGSSSIQATLSKSPLPANVRYLDLGEINHSGPIVTMFGRRPELYHGNRKRGLGLVELQDKRANLMKKLDRQLQELDEATGIISGEDICDLSEKELTGLRDFIKQHGHSIRIICYVRDPVGYIESAFQQMIKGGLNHFRIDLAWPRYRKLDNLIQAFGKSVCEFPVFDREKLYNNDVVADFVARTKIDMSELNVTQVNEGISLTALKFIYVYRRYGPGYGSGPDTIRINNGIVSRLARIKGPKLQLSSRLLSEYFEKCTDELIWLRDTVDINFLHPQARKELSTSIDAESELLNFDETEREALREVSKEFNIYFEDLDMNNLDEISAAIEKLAPKKNIPGNTIQLPTQCSGTSLQSIPFSDRGKKPWAIAGKSGYLFLAGGSHSPMDFASGRRSPTVNSLQCFKRNLRFRSRNATRTGASYLHLLIPDKHYICQKYFPYALGNSLASKYLQAIKQDDDLINNVIYPLETLQRNAETSCSRVDTHLTAKGNLSVMDVILQRLADLGDKRFATIDIGQLLALAEGLIHVTDETWPGDLGSKCNPIQIEKKTNFRLPEGVSFHSNYLQGGNNGIMDAYMNKSVCNAPRVIIMGDSFGCALSRIFSLFCSETLFLRTPYYHPEIVSSMRPDLVITQNVERYLSDIKGDASRFLFFMQPYINGGEVNISIEDANVFMKIISPGKRH